jgi:ribosomal protein S18 acetylase RimI-like enzyme
MPVQITKSFGLTANQLAQIDQLAAICNTHEELTMKLNWSRLNNRPPHETNDFLACAADQLVGYLALYAFNDREVEVSAMTHPDFRRQGIFARLAKEARREIARRGIPDLLFFCERKSTAGITALQAIGGQYETSEYRMDLRQNVPPVAVPAGLQTRPARAEDIPLMAHMDNLCFGMPIEETTKNLQADLVEGNRKQATIITVNGETVGKIYVVHGGPDVYIGAFCMLPEHRGKGYGKAVLSQTVANLTAQGHKNITLEVATENDNALLLYQHCGFETTTAFDYYRLPAAAN